jgi:hypothetical protein
MDKTPIQNVIDKVVKLAREAKHDTEEKRKLNIVISYLWDELDNERKTMVDVFEKSKKEHTTQITGNMWVNKHFMDYKKFL